MTLGESGTPFQKWKLPIPNISIWNIGYSVERIHEQYPTVPKELVKKLIGLLNKNRTIKILH